MARHVGRFFDRAKSFVHEAILAGVRAFFEITELTEESMRLVDEEAQAQIRYFDRFEQEVVSAPPLEIAEPGFVPTIAPMTAKRFISRTEMYGDAAWGAAQEVNRKQMARMGDYTMERRVHGRLVDDMCQTCSAAVAMGWVPIGTLPRIGDSECLGNCHCYFQYQDAFGNIVTTVRKSKGKRAPKAVPPILAKPAPLPEPPTVKVVEVPKPAPAIVLPPASIPVPPPPLPLVVKPAPQPALLPEPTIVQVIEPPLPPEPQPKSKPVKVKPVEPTPEPPDYLMGPWVDANGKAIMYHWVESE